MNRGERRSGIWKVIFGHDVLLQAALNVALDSSGRLQMIDEKILDIPNFCLGKGFETEA